MPRLFFFLGLLLLAGPASGQVPPPPATPLKPMQAITFFVLSAPAGERAPPAEFKFVTHHGVEEVRLGLRDQSRAYVREQSAGLELFRETPAPPDLARPPPPPGTPPVMIRVPMLSVPVPAEWKNVLVLLASDAAGRVTAAILVDQSARALPVGRLLLISFLTRDLMMRFGTAEGAIPARGRIQFPMTPGTGPRPNMVLMRAAAQNAAGGWDLVFARKISVSPAFRQIALLLPEGGGGADILVLAPAVDDPPDAPL